MCRVRWPVVSRLARGDGLESDGDGANLVQLTSAGWPETAAPRWSPDGSHVVVFHARPEGPGDIFTIPVSGGVAKRVTDNPADEWGATWSPDGRWIYFGSNRTGRFEVWKVRADGSGTAVQVTRNGGVGPTVSPDGRRTYYAKGSELWRVPVEGGDEVRVLDSLTDWSRFVVVDDGIYFTPRRSSSDETQTDFTIEFLNVSDRRVQTIARLAKPPYLGMSVSPDGRQLLYSQVDQSGTDLMVVEDVR